MKRKIISALPEVFCLRPNSDYSRFIAASIPTVAAKNNWANVGHHLQSAMTQVEQGARKKN